MRRRSSLPSVREFGKAKRNEHDQYFFIEDAETLGEIQDEEQVYLFSLFQVSSTPFYTV